MGYGPRRINFVTILCALVAVGLVYGGVKFIPHYWRAYKVQSVLEDNRHAARQVNDFGYDPRENEIVNEIYEDLAEIGIDRYDIDVYFTPNLDELHAEWTVIVSHPFGKTTELAFHKSVHVERKRR